MKKKVWQDAIDNSLNIISNNPELQKTWAEMMGKGYFPKQLPPPFQTISFGSEVNDNQENFIKVLKNTLWASDKSTMQIAQLYRYSYARPRQLRRLLSIPNPAHFILLSLELAANWIELSKISSDSSFSMSKPTRNLIGIENEHSRTASIFDETEDDNEESDEESENDDEEKRQRALEFSNTWEELAERKLGCRSSARFIAKLDIARFYPTIYTHIIPWILHGKDVAKSKRNDYTLLGNRLDTLIRHAQDGQTLGLPVGPDSSFLIAECILSKIDEVLEERLKEYEYSVVRMVDDYEFACFDRATTEKCVSVLQEILFEYELELNTYKSEVFELPQPLQPPEFFQLQVFDLKKPNIQVSDTPEKLKRTEQAYKIKLLNFIDLAFQGYNSRNTKGVLKFAIKKINATRLSFNVYIDFMCQCMVLEPGSIETVLQKVAKLNLWNDQKISKAFAKCFGLIIIEHSELGHASEVAWALWGYMLFSLCIPKNITECVSKMSDSVVLLLALDACEKGLMEPYLINRKIKEYLSADYLYGEQWLIAYEAVIKGWAPPGFRKYLNDNEFFKLLRKEGVEFYNSRAISDYRHIMESWEPDFGYNEPWDADVDSDEHDE